MASAVKRRDVTTGLGLAAADNTDLLQPLEREQKPSASAEEDFFFPRNVANTLFRVGSSGDLTPF